MRKLILALLILPLSALAGTASLSWVAPTGEYTGIDVWQADSAAGPFRSVATLAPGTTVYTMDGLSPGSRWWYVTASLGSVVSPPSNVVTKLIPADPPPVDPCAVDPLTITNLAWPSAVTGRRSLGYNTGTKSLASLVFTAPNRLVFTDTRGCVVTVTR